MKEAQFAIYLVKMDPDPIAVWEYGILVGCVFWSENDGITGAKSGKFEDADTPERHAFLIAKETDLRAQGYRELTEEEHLKHSNTLLTLRGVEFYDPDDDTIDDSDDPITVLEVGYAIGDGTLDDALDKRNAAMEVIEAALEAAELGEWIGSDVGMGSADLAFEVTDGAAAKALTVSTLKGTKFDDYAHIEIVNL